VQAFAVSVGLGRIQRDQVCNALLHGVILSLARGRFHGILFRALSYEYKVFSHFRCINSQAYLSLHPAARVRQGHSGQDQVLG
jgi:hypothetical protein